MLSWTTRSCSNLDDHHKKRETVNDVLDLDTPKGLRQHKKKITNIRKRLLVLPLHKRFPLLNSRRSREFRASNSYSPHTQRRGMLTIDRGGAKHHRVQPRMASIGIDLILFVRLAYPTTVFRDAGYAAVPQHA
ncbi:hypothetical protein DTO169E5_1688 [Paecilomyces variotii]|nr:hypothetical protein DTO169E5_1688 [Paecilomyces variotii]